MITRQLPGRHGPSARPAPLQPLPPPRARAATDVQAVARPLRRILVVADRSPAAAGALRAAGLLAQSHGATLDVANVLYRWGPPPPAHEFVDIPRDLVDHRLARIAPDGERDPVSDTSRWTIRAIDADHTALTIAEVAAAGRYDLIVVPNPDGWVDRWLRPAPALAVARRTSIPVLAVPPDLAALPTRAVVGIGGREDDADLALTAARVLRTPASLDLVHVRPYGSGHLHDPVEAARFSSLRRRIERDIGAPLRRRLAWGDAPAPGLVDHAAATGADLIVLGAGIGRPSLVERVLGGTRRQVLRAGGCSVLLRGAPSTS